MVSVPPKNFFNEFTHMPTKLKPRQLDQKGLKPSGSTNAKSSRLKANPTGHKHDDLNHDPISVEESQSVSFTTDNELLDEFENYYGVFDHASIRWNINERFYDQNNGRVAFMLQNDDSGEEFEAYLSTDGISLENKDGRPMERFAGFSFDSEDLSVML